MIFLDEKRSPSTPSLQQFADNGYVTYELRQSQRSPAKKSTTSTILNGSNNLYIRFEKRKTFSYWFFLLNFDDSDQFRFLIIFDGYLKILRNIFDLFSVNPRLGQILRNLPTRKIRFR